MMTPVLPLPRYQGNDPDVKAWADQLVFVLERHFAIQTAPGGDGVWTASNVTAARTFDPTTATLGDTAQAVGTLIEDLQQFGAIGQ